VKFLTPKTKNMKIIKMTTFISNIIEDKQFGHIGFYQKVKSHNEFLLSTPKKKDFNSNLFIEENEIILDDDGLVKINFSFENPIIQFNHPLEPTEREFEIKTFEMLLEIIASNFEYKDDFGEHQSFTYENNVLVLQAVADKYAQFIG
jgi:hypothetical protein